MKELLGWAEDEGLREGGSRIGRSKQSECFLAYGRLAALLVWTVTPDDSHARCWKRALSGESSSPLTGATSRLSAGLPSGRPPATPFGRAYFR